MVSSCCARRKSFSFLFRSAPLALSLPPLPCRNSFLFITSASLLTACTNNNSLQSLVCHQHSHHTKVQTTTVCSHWSAISTVTTPRHKQQQCAVTGLPSAQPPHQGTNNNSVQSLVCHQHSHHTKAQTTTVCSHWSAISTVTTPRHKQQQCSVTGLPSAQSPHQGINNNSVQSLVCHQQSPHQGTNNNSVQSLVCHQHSHHTKAQTTTVCSHWSAISTVTTPRHKQQQSSVTGLPSAQSPHQGTNNNSVQSLVCHQHSHHTKAQTTTVFSHWSAISTVTTPRHKQQQCAVTGLPSAVTTPRHKQQQCSVTGLPSAQSPHQGTNNNSVQSLVCHQHSHHTKAQATTVFSHWSAISTVTTPRHKQQQCSVTGLPSAQSPHQGTNNNSLQSLVCHQHSHHTKAQTTTVFSHWSAISTVTTPRHKQQQCSVTGLPSAQSPHQGTNNNSVQSLVCHQHSHHTKARTTTVFSHWSAISTVTTPRHKQSPHQGTNNNNVQ